MLKVGLTGGIASGKSTVGEMLVALGAHLIQADAIAHDLMRPGEKVYDEVVRNFGSGILDSDRTINRRKLAEAAFGPSGTHQKSRIEELNRIVHPAVIRKQNEWMESVRAKDPHAIAIVEAALILEAGATRDFDKIVVVTCRPEQRIERWAARMHVSLEAARQEVARRMAAQLPDSETIKAADYVIENSGTPEETRAEVKILYERLRLEAEKT